MPPELTFKVAMVVVHAVGLPSESVEVTLVKPRTVTSSAFWPPARVTAPAKSTLLMYAAPFAVTPFRMPPPVFAMMLGAFPPN